MSREVRRVPPGWEHPREYRPGRVGVDRFMPQFAHPPVLDPGEPPTDPEYVMPQWGPEEATAFQLYETTTEGQPISPVFPTAEGLIEWLQQPHPIGFGGATIALDEAEARAWVLGE